MSGTIELWITDINILTYDWVEFKLIYLVTWVVVEEEVDCTSPLSDMQVAACLSSMNTKIRRQGEKY